MFNMDQRDHCQWDHFERLSAYLDGELTVAQRQQVEQWLATDPEAQRLYQRLLTLKALLPQLPVPTSPCPADYLAAQVIAKAQCRPRAVWVWGGIGATLAASVVGILNGLILNPLPRPQVAITSPASLNPEASPLPIEPTAGGLMLSLDRPPVAIPVSKTAPTAMPAASPQHPTRE